jgi:hypothetical protein
MTPLKFFSNGEKLFCEEYHYDFFTFKEPIYVPEFYKVKSYTETIYSGFFGVNPDSLA